MSSATKMNLAVAGGIARLTLDDGRANAIGRGFLSELEACLAEAEASDAHSLILFGRPDFYSGGLDLKELPTLPPDELARTAGHFVEMMKRLFLFPKPIIAAANGHAIAGGMMIYLAADLRLAVDRGDAKMGLNEAVTGIPITGGTAALCTATIPPQYQTEMMLHGRLVTPRVTLDREITHELASDAKDLERRALARAEGLADVNLEAYSLNKRMIREPVWEAAAEKGLALGADAPSRNVFEGLRR